MAVERILAETPDLVVLDVMLPGLDGVAVCRRIRPWYRGAIVMLTALAEERDQLAGFGVGADDYIIKTSAGRLLSARIHAHLRRQDRLEAQPPEANHLIDLGWLVIDAASHEAVLAGKRLDLTGGEFSLLLFLAKRAGTVVSRTVIARDLDGHAGHQPDDRAIDLRISRLRRKLGTAEESAKRLKAVRGEGYLLPRRDPLASREPAGPS
jgi:two-component system response regulator RstA